LLVPLPVRRPPCRRIRHRPGNSSEANLQAAAAPIAAAVSRAALGLHRPARARGPAPVASSPVTAAAVVSVCWRSRERLGVDPV